MCNKDIIRVALIDDHDLFRDVICKYIDQFGFKLVFEAANGKIALEKMVECDPIPDVCIVDVNMPVMNGFETAKALRKKYPGLSILAFSTNDDDKTLVKMLDSGANGYVLKSAEPDELRKAIQTVYNG